MCIWRRYADCLCFGDLWHFLQKLVLYMATLQISVTLQILWIIYTFELPYLEITLGEKAITLWTKDSTYVVTDYSRGHYYLLIQIEEYILIYHSYAIFIGVKKLLNASLDCFWEVHDAKHSIVKHEWQPWVILVEERVVKYTDRRYMYQVPFMAFQ